MSTPEQSSLASVKDVVALTSAVVGLITAWVGLKVVLKKQAVPDGALHFAPVRLDNPGVRTRPWNLRRVRWLFLLPVAVNVLVGVGSLGVTGELLAVNLVVAAAIVVFLFVLRMEPPSRTMKSAEYVLDAEPKDVLERSLLVLTNSGARIGRYDQDGGLIQASTSFTWRSAGEVLSVRVWKDTEGKSRLRFESDAVQPSLLMDWGANARNLERFQAGLLTTRDQSKAGGT